MLSINNIVGRWDYYKGQSDIYRFVLDKLLSTSEGKTLGQIFEQIEDYINEPFEEYDENSHYYKDGQKDCLPFFQRLLIPLSHTIQKTDIDILVEEIQKKNRAVCSELNDILLFLSRR